MRKVVVRRSDYALLQPPRVFTLLFNNCEATLSLSSFLLVIPSNSAVSTLNTQTYQAARATRMHSGCLPSVTVDDQNRGSACSCLHFQFPPTQKSSEPAGRERGGCFKHFWLHLGLRASFPCFQIFKAAQRLCSV